LVVAEACFKLKLPVVERWIAHEFVLAQAKVAAERERRMDEAREAARVRDGERRKEREQNEKPKGEDERAKRWEDSREEQRYGPTLVPSLVMPGTTSQTAETEWHLSRTSAEHRSAAKQDRSPRQRDSRGRDGVSRGHSEGTKDGRKRQAGRIGMPFLCTWVALHARNSLSCCTDTCILERRAGSPAVVGTDTSHQRKDKKDKKDRKEKKEKKEKEKRHKRKREDDQNEKDKTGKSLLEDELRRKALGQMKHLVG
jgi:hypothetical protein